MYLFNGTRYYTSSSPSPLQLACLLDNANHLPSSLLPTTHIKGLLGKRRGSKNPLINFICLIIVIVLCKYMTASPMDTQHQLIVYISSVSGNILTKKRQQHVEQVLQALHIPHTLLDVTQHPEGRERVKEHGTTIPCLFKGDEFVMGYDEFAELVETGEVARRLVPS